MQVLKSNWNRCHKYLQKGTRTYLEPYFIKNTSVMKKIVIANMCSIAFQLLAYSNKNRIFTAVFTRIKTQALVSDYQLIDITNY